MIGKQNYKNANRYATYGLMTSGLVMGLLCLGVSLSADFLAKWILNAESTDDEMRSMIKILMLINAVGIFFDGLRFNMLQVLRACHDHNLPTAISTASLWLSVLLAYLLGFKTRLGVFGVAMGYASGFVTSCCALFPRWYKNTQPNAIAEETAKRGL